MVETLGCEWCGNTYQAKRRGVRFCSSYCRGAAYRDKNYSEISDQRRDRDRQMRYDAYLWNQHVIAMGGDRELVEAETMSAYMKVCLRDVQLAVDRQSGGKVYHLARRRPKEK